MCVCVSQQLSINGCLIPVYSCHVCACVRPCHLSLAPSVGCSFKTPGRIGEWGLSGRGEWGALPLFLPPPSHLPVAATPNRAKQQHGDGYQDSPADESRLRSRRPQRGSWTGFLPPPTWGTSSMGEEGGEGVLAPEQGYRALGTRGH